MKNNTNTLKYIQNKQATKASAQIKLPDREKNVSDIDLKTYLKQTKFTEDVGSKNINTNAITNNTKQGGFIIEENK